MKRYYTLCYCSFFICITSYAGIMRHDIEVQDYRDFGENLGKYSINATNIPVYKKDGTLSGYLQFSMPDFAMVVSGGYASLVTPSYLAGVRHNRGYTGVNFGHGAQYAATYKLINRNNSQISDIDFHLPRLNKVSTDAIPARTVDKTEIRKGDTARYSWYTRVGGGTQSQVNDEQTKRITLTGAYNWVSGGTINTNGVVFAPGTLRAQNYGPDSPLTSPLTLGTMGGDSGSPIFVYDEVDKVWKIAGVLHASISDSGVYGKVSGWEYIPDNYIANLMAANTAPDVTDAAAERTISWGADAITQASDSWSWQGLAADYKSTAPSAASNEELDTTKDLRFNGAGGPIVLQDAVNMGAGKLQFSNDYSLTSADGVNATWAGGGVEVDAGKTVLWRVNGLAGDALHKIGEGTLHINATGVNAGSLNTGAGTVILDQQADTDGNKQAFSSVTLVSGRPTVVLRDADQLSTDNIFFGYRGGTLDLNGNSLTFKNIHHTDGGATLVNHDADEAATLILTGYTYDDVIFHKWASTGRGTAGDIYKYGNPHSKQAEYFQLLTSKYGGYPTNQTSNAAWKYLGTDPEVAREHYLAQSNKFVFRGFIGEVDESKNNGELNVNYQPVSHAGLMALTGGMNINGTLNVEKGTLLISGQPVPHAGGVAIDDDWSASLFVADNITVGKNAIFQIGEYAQVKATIDAGESSRLMFGYNSSAELDEQIWRCYAVINSDTTTCSKPKRTENELNKLPASVVTGNITLADKASLYLGKVNYTGAISSSGVTSMTLGPAAYWRVTGNSKLTSLKALRSSTLSMASTENWSAKQLRLDSLDATGLNVGLGINPSKAQSDKLTITHSATGGNNILDVSLILDTDEPVSLLKDLVMVDAPGGTAHSYFTVADSAVGFSIYTPDYEVKDEAGRVQWLLKHNQEPEITADPEENAADERKQSDKRFNPDDWFTIRDNRSLIADTRALLASRQYLFSEAVTRLNDRAARVRAEPEISGAWATLEDSEGCWQGYCMTQHRLHIGWDTWGDGQLSGVSASYAQGKVRGNGRESHRLASVGIDYSWSPNGGWFIDAASRYMYLNQALSLNPQLSIESVRRDSHILAGSLKTGYQFRMADDSLTISPWLAVSGGYLSGYRLQGKDAQVSLRSGTPYFASAGLEVKKRGIWNSYPDIMLTGGIEYQYSPGHAGPKTVLSDRQNDRQYDSWSDNRYRMQLGIEGKITDRLAVNAKVKNSVGGDFKLNYSGMFGVSYRF